MIYWERSAFWDPTWASWSPAVMGHRAKWSTQKLQKKCKESVWLRFYCVAQKNGPGLDSTRVVTTLSRITKLNGGPLCWRGSHCVEWRIIIWRGASPCWVQRQSADSNGVTMVSGGSLCWADRSSHPVLSHQIEWRVTTVSGRSQRWVSA